MKKLLMVVLATLISVSVHAREVVNVVWPFALASTSADFSRAMIEEANKSQDKYRFVLVHRGGAGGAAAANSVLNSNQPSILATSVSFFIRPNLYPNRSYDIDKFDTLLVQCTAPFMIVSKKFKTLNDLKNKERITVGIGGLGTTAHLLAEELKKHYPGIVVVPYVGAVGGVADVLGGNVDVAIGFYSTVGPLIESNQLNLLGASGNKSYFGVPTLVEQGVAGPEKVATTMALFVPKTVDSEVTNEWRTIFQNTITSTRVQRSYATEDCIDPGITSADQLSNWFNEQEKYFRSITKNIQITD